MPVNLEDEVNRSEAIGIRVNPKVKAAAISAAGDDNRSLASLVETLLISHLTSNGYLGDDRPRRRAGESNGSGVDGMSGETLAG